MLEHVEAAEAANAARKGILVASICSRRCGARAACVLEPRRSPRRPGHRRRKRGFTHQHVACAAADFEVVAQTREMPPQASDEPLRARNQ